MKKAASIFLKPRKFITAWQWHSHPKNFWGEMFDFRPIILFCLEKRFSKHKMTIFSKSFGGPWPLWPPWLRVRRLLW